MSKTKVYYEKVGRKYVPVSEYNQDLRDSFHKGAHLVIVEPGHSSTKYNIDPNYAALMAASNKVKDKMVSTLVEASKLKPVKKELTPEQHKAYLAFAKTMGDEFHSLYTDSASNIVEAGLQVLMEEANKMLNHPSVKDAYEKFLLVSKLTKEE